MDKCPGSGREAEVHGQRLVKRGISYTYRNGQVLCDECDTYIHLKGAHSVPVATIPDHQPKEAWPR